MDALLLRIVELVEDEGFDDVRVTLHLISGETVAGKLVPSPFALQVVAEAHIGLATALLDDDETNFAQALTVRVAADQGENVVRVSLDAVAWWMFLPDPLDGF